VEALLNPSTGRRFGGEASGGSETPEVDAGNLGSAAASTCGACFSCTIPELRAIWLLVSNAYSNQELHTLSVQRAARYMWQVAMTVGCVKDEARFPGRMEQHCLDSGGYYAEEACGPRTGSALYMSNAEWRATYTAHRNFDAGRVQSFAGKFEQLAKDDGGGSNGYSAQRIADAWFKRDVALGEDQAGNFFRVVCRQMRIESEIDIGPGFSNYSKNTMPYLVGDFLYQSCQMDKGFEMYARARIRCFPTGATLSHALLLCAGVPTRSRRISSAASTSSRTACKIAPFEPTLKPSRHGYELYDGNQRTDPFGAQFRHAAVPSRPRAVPRLVRWQRDRAQAGLHDVCKQGRAERARAWYGEDRARSRQLQRQEPHLPRRSVCWRARRAVHPVRVAAARAGRLHGCEDL